MQAIYHVKMSFVKKASEATFGQNLKSAQGTNMKG